MNTSIPQKRCSICKELQDITCFYKKGDGRKSACIVCNRGKPYVYALSYPESMGGCIFYVGKGRRDRIHQHEREARGLSPMKNERKCMSIWEIWDHGEQVVKTKLFFFATDEEALLYEFALLFFLPNLTNTIESMVHRRNFEKVVYEIPPPPPKVKKLPPPKVKKQPVKKEPSLRMTEEERCSLAREVTRRIAEQKNQG